MGATPHKAVTNRFPQEGGNRTSEAPGVVLDPITGGGGVETPLPNDSLKACLSPPVGGRLRSFRRDWQTNKCSSNVLNIITNGYVLPFLSKPNLVRFPLILSEYKARSKGPSTGHSYPVSSVKERNRKGGKRKISRVFQSPVPSTQASPKVEASHRPKQAQHFSTRRKVQNGNSRVHQDLPDSRGMGIVDRSVGRLPTHPHPSKLKEIPKVLLQVTGVPVHLPPIRTSHSPPGLYNDCKGSETNGPLQRTQTSPIPGRLADQVPVSGGSPSEHSGGGRPIPVLGLDNKSGKIRTETYSGVFVRGLRIPSKFSPCKTHSREMAQTSGFDPKTARCLMSLIGLLASTEKMVPEGRLHMRPFQFHLKEHWRYPQSLDSLLPWTEAIAAHLGWWQNPSNVMKGADLHPKDHSIQLFTDASNEGWGAHLDQNSTKDLWSDREKRATHKRPRIEGVLELKASRTSARTKQC